MKSTIRQIALILALGATLYLMLIANLYKGTGTIYWNPLSEDARPELVKFVAVGVVGLALLQAWKVWRSRRS